MVNGIIAIKDPIIATLPVLSNPELNCLISQDWIILENAQDILKIFYEVTTEISAKEINSMGQVLKDELLARFGNIEESHLITQATLLDPRFKKFAFSTNNSSSALWKEFDETVVNLIGGSNSSVAGIIEVDKYLNQPLISRAENPLVWWAERKKVYPRLYTLVKRRLCIMATSVPCERIFSKAGQVVSERRSRLSISKISQILFLNHNM